MSRKGWIIAGVTAWIVAIVLVAPHPPEGSAGASPAEAPPKPVASAPASPAVAVSAPDQPKLGSVAAADQAERLGQMMLYDPKHPDDWITLWRDAQAAQKAIDLVADGLRLSDNAFTYLRACRVPQRVTGLVRQQYQGGAMFWVITEGVRGSGCIGFVLRAHLWRPGAVPAAHHVPPLAADPATDPRKPPIACKNEDAYQDGVYWLLFDLTDPGMAPGCKRALARFLHL